MKIKHWGWLVINSLISIFVWKLIVKEWSIAIIIIGSLILHEFGHWVLIQLKDPAAYIVVTPLGGCVVPTQPKETDLYDGPIHGPEVYFAGIGVNFLLTLIGIALYFSGNPYWETIGQKIATINSIFTFSNLLPLRKGMIMLDGWAILSLIYQSLQIKSRKRLRLWFRLTPICLTVIYATISSFQKEMLFYPFFLLMITYILYRRVPFALIPYVYDTDNSGQTGLCAYFFMLFLSYATMVWFWPYYITSVGS